jgi:hypothetical protein
MSPIKTVVLNPVRTHFTEHFSNAIHLVAIIGVAAIIVGGSAFTVVQGVF